MNLSRSRREARFHEIEGVARWNAKDRRDLHSRTDAFALQRHSNSGIRPERRRNPAAPSRSRRNGVLCCAATDCSNCRQRIGKVVAATCDRRHHRAISAEYARFSPPHERQAPITQLATKRRDPRRDRRQPGGKTGQKGCDDIGTLGRAVCTHRMGLGGSRQRLGNGGCRQRVYDARNRLTGGRKRRSTCISAGPYGWSAA